MKKNREKGFALLFTMLVLILLSVVVISSVRTTTFGERVSGSYMDRTRAFQEAERALAQGKAMLMDNSALCLDGCQVSSSGVVADSGLGQAFGATTWDWSSASLNIVTDNNASYIIDKLKKTDTAGVPVEFVTPSTGQTRTDCQPYSILGRGQGNGGGEVVLQTVVWLCPI